MTNLSSMIYTAEGRCYKSWDSLIVEKGWFLVGLSGVGVPRLMTPTLERVSGNLSGKKVYTKNMCLHKRM